jgi:predicted O-methyltransferase YrrM
MLQVIRTAARAWRDTRSKRAILQSDPALGPALAIKTHMKPQELQTLYRLAAHASTALEIGSYLGASACAISAGFKSPQTGKTLVCIDTWQNDAMTEGAIDTAAAFKENTKQFQSVIVPVRAWSTEAVGEVSRIVHQLDLLFIDGDHSFEGASADWTSYKHFLRPGSWVAFHDVGWAEGVQKTVNDLVKPMTNEQHTHPNLWWGRIA